MGLMSFGICIYGFVPGQGVGHSALCVIGRPSLYCAVFVVSCVLFEFGSLKIPLGLFTLQSEQGD